MYLNSAVMYRKPTITCTFNYMHFAYQFDSTPHFKSFIISPVSRIVLYLRFLAFLNTSRFSERSWTKRVSHSINVRFPKTPRVEPFEEIFDALATKLFLTCFRLFVLVMGKGISSFQIYLNV